MKEILCTEIRIIVLKKYFSILKNQKKNFNLNIKKCFVYYNKECLFYAHLKFHLSIENKCLMTKISDITNDILKNSSIYIYKHPLCVMKLLLPERDTYHLWYCTNLNSTPILWINQTFYTLKNSNNLVNDFSSPPSVVFPTT